MFDPGVGPRAQYHCRKGGGGSERYKDQEADDTAAVHTTFHRYATIPYRSICAFAFLRVSRRAGETWLPAAAFARAVRSYSIPSDFARRVRTLHRPGRYISV